MVITGSSMSEEEISQVAILNCPPGILLEFLPGSHTSSAVSLVLRQESPHWFPFAPPHTQVLSLLTHSFTWEERLLSGI